MSNEIPGAQLIKPRKLSKKIQAARSKGLKVLDERTEAQIKKDAKKVRDAWKNAAIRREAQGFGQDEGNDDG